MTSLKWVIKVENVGGPRRARRPAGAVRGMVPAGQRGRGDEVRRPRPGRAFGAGTVRATVVATGRNEFGRFVSRGTLDGATLTLCRRYVGERDPRLAEGPDAALESITEPAAPWRALPFQPPATKRKKKTKALEVEDDAGGEGGAAPTPAASAPPPAAKTLEKPKRTRKCAPIIAVDNFGGRR